MINGARRARHQIAAPMIATNGTPTIMARGSTRLVCPFIPQSRFYPSGRLCAPLILLAQPRQAAAMPLGRGLMRSTGRLCCTKQ